MEKNQPLVKVIARIDPWGTTQFSVVTAENGYTVRADTTRPIAYELADRINTERSINPEEI